MNEKIIKCKTSVDDTILNEVIEKAERLKEILEEANALARELASIGEIDLNVEIH